MWLSGSDGAYPHKKNEALAPVLHQGFRTAKRAPGLVGLRLRIMRGLLEWFYADSAAFRLTSR